jgi:hypothetical protein
VKERVQLHAECTEDEVEQEAAWCQEAMSNVYNATATRIMIHAELTRWFNDNINERRKALGTTKPTRWNSKEPGWAKTELQKSLRRTKNQKWSDKLQNLLGAEVWRAAHCANPRVGMTVEASTDREGKEVNPATEKEAMLSCEKFPPNDNDQFYELHPGGSTPTHVTEQAIKRALNSQSVKKPRVQTCHLLAPYGYSGSGIKRESWG